MLLLLESLLYMSNHLSGATREGAPDLGAETAPQHPGGAEHPGGEAAPERRAEQAVQDPRQHPVQRSVDKYSTAASSCTGIDSLCSRLTKATK